MPTKPSKKVECLNPNTGRKMNVDAGTYDIFSKAIYHTLKKEKKGISYTDIVNGIKKCFKEAKTIFEGAIDWYAVTVKNDMEARGVIESYIEKGKKLHRLKR
jgi:uncharacterized protein DUF6958